MTDLQKKELEILCRFIDVCEKLSLTYYLVCGSALGAVKYNGFIPWDDDIDVALPRYDYEIFLNKAQTLLPDWCFVQNYRTEFEFPLIGTKLRDSRTTFAELGCQGLNINQGVFIDVFPLDAYLEDEHQRCKLKRLQRRLESQRRVRLKYRRFISRQVFCFRHNWYYLLFKLFGMYSNTQKYIRRYEALISSGDYKQSCIICNHANSISPLEYAPREQYGNGTWATFEGLKVRIPERYDEYLTQKYGDWRAELPKEQQVGHHYAEVIDLDRPYTDYIVHLKNGKILIKNPKS